MQANTTPTRTADRVIPFARLWRTMGTRAVSWLLLPLIVSMPFQLNARPFAERELRSSSTLVAAPWSDALTHFTRQLDEKFEGRVAAYLSDPHRGVKWGYASDVPFYLASGVKLAFMVEAFRQRELGMLTFDEKVVYTEDDIRDGATRVNRTKLGTRLSIGKLVEWMMVASDNAASDMVARRVTLPRIDEGLESLGIQGFTRLTFLVDVRRGIYRELDPSADDLTATEVRKIRWTRIWDPQLRELERKLGKPSRTYSRDDLWAAYDRFYETKVNHATMASVGLLLEKMVRGELVSEKASDEMFGLMSRAKTSTNRLLGKLPRGTRVAHKTGSQFRRLCDLGIVTLRDKSPLVVAICTAGGDVGPAERVVAEITRRAYDFVHDARRPADRPVRQERP